MKVAPLVSRILFVGGISLLLLFLAYFLHETVGVVQRAVGSTSQVLTDKANRLAIPAPIVVMVFLTKRGLEPTANIWNEWHADARRSLTRLGLNVDDFLRGVVHHHPNFTDTDIKLPDWLKPHVDPHPVTSEWGSLLPAMHKALSFAHEKNQDATYFIFVSETTVPLKSFTSIWSGIWADPRSRADAFCREHFNGNPKHSQWIMLNSRHAMYLIENEQWKTPRVNWVAGACGVGVAASDEYWPLRTIRHAPDWNNLDQDVILKGDSHDYDSLQSWTFVSWRKFIRSVAERVLGEYDQDIGHPAEFSSLDAGFLRSLVQRESVWFFRKVNEDIPVYRCSLSLEDFYNDQLGQGQTLIHTSKQRDAFDHTVCSLKDALPGLWRDNAMGQKPLTTAKQFS